MRNIPDPFSQDSRKRSSGEHAREAFQPMSGVSCTPEWREFINQPENAAWMAWDGDQALGFIRFDAYDNGGSAILEGDAAVFISGAYIRPEFRGHGAATTILDAAMKDYAAKGYRRCTLDFESTNPYASAFWLRYFQPVAYSLLRILEWLPPSGKKPDRPS